MRYTLLYPGDLLVELVPARVVITYEIAGVVAEDPEMAQRDLRAGRQRPVPHQAFFAGCAR